MLPRTTCMSCGALWTLHIYCVVDRCGSIYCFLLNKEKPKWSKRITTFSFNFISSFKLKANFSFKLTPQGWQNFFPRLVRLTCFHDRIHGDLFQYFIICTDLFLLAEDEFNLPISHRTGSLEWIWFEILLLHIFYEGYVLCRWRYVNLYWMNRNHCFPFDMGTRVRRDRFRLKLLVHVPF